MHGSSIAGGGFGISQGEVDMSTRKVFHDSITELPPQSGHTATGLLVHAVEPAHMSDLLTLNFSLAPAAALEDELARRVEQGQQISAQELDSKYGLTEAETAPLKSWLTKNGYRDVKESSGHTSIIATASADVVAKTLEVEFTRVTKDGITYTAARTAPSLPSDVGDKVHAVTGLQPFLHLNKHRNYRHPPAVAAAAAIAAGKATSSSPPYLPSAILRAFDGANLGLDGSGQTIGILIDTFPNDADLQTFWQQAKVPGKLQNIKKIDVGPSAMPPPEGEESLDVEWASGIAPGATINIYATGSLAFGPLDAGLQRILDDAKANPSLRVVSISLGLGEQNTPAGAIRIQSQIYLRLAALGVNVFVSSGDDGSNPQSTLQVEYPSSDPNVVAVGGTTLVLNANGTIKSEAGWAGSGGGKSVKFKRPTWQAGVGVAAGSTRLVPDVAAGADPNTGALVVLNGAAHQIGGTSWSAPTWAAIVTLINEARVKTGKKALPFLNPLIYPLIQAASFRDVTGGSNGAYHSAPGHDLVTGIGSPNVRNLVKALLERA
jgi:kumamolisin